MWGTSMKFLLKMNRTLLLLGVATLLPVTALHAQEPYKIGVSGMFTGPISSYYAGQAEGIRVYFDAVNANGGIDGHPVEVTFRDNRGDPSVAAADAQAFVDSDVLTGTLLSASNTYPGFSQATIRGELPVVNGSWCYGPSVPGGGPEVAGNFFCSGFSGLAPANAFVKFFEDEIAKIVDEKKAAYALTDAPGNVVSIQKAIRDPLEHNGWVPGGYFSTAPLTTTDYGPAARAIIASGAKAVLTFCPTDCEIQYIRALRAAGFKGPIVASVGSAESQFAALRDENLYLQVNTSLASEGKPIHKKIAEAAQQFKSRAEASDLNDGWAVAVAIEKGLRECGFPCDREKLTGIFNANFTVDDQDYIDLVGGKITWGPGVHHMTSKVFHVVRWSEAEGRFVRFGSDIAVEDPGLVFPKL